MPGSFAERGQAMVEFAIMLIIFFACVTGMLTIMRLLTFQFWARQEARFLAFEQDWAPHAFYGDPVGEPKTKLSDGAFFGRSDVVSSRNAAKNVANDGDLEGLLSANIPNDDLAPHARIGEQQESPVMLASGTGETPWYGRKTGEWFAPGGVISRASTFVESAFASQLSGSLSRNGERGEPPAPKDEPAAPANGDYRDRLGPKITDVLHEAGFGPRLCEAMTRFSHDHGDPFQLRRFRSGDCESWVEAEFGQSIATNMDIPEVYRGYGDRIGSGMSAADALEQTVRLEVANQYYSFFDASVKVGQLVAIGDTAVETSERLASLGDSSIIRMITDARYLGSSIAIGVLVEKAVEILGHNPLSRDVTGLIAFENSVNGVLHTDADDVLPVVSPFFLSPFDLPVPPAFGSLGGGLQEAVMRNLLAQPEDSGSVSPLITDSNKEVVVTYDAAGGLFPSLKPVEGAENAKLSARMYLVTQPWHLERRENGTGDYREKGTETDSASEETEEGVLRRRVLGMWIIPDNIPAFLAPVANLAGLGGVANALNAVGNLSGVISFIKRFATDNPLLDVANALAKIPVVGSLVPVPPRFPAVRPDAYPGSKELKGMTMDQPDRMILKKPREFSDYVDEQRDNDPDADPTFN